jgi:hypothetical protein
LLYEDLLSRILRREQVENRTLRATFHCSSDLPVFVNPFLLVHSKKPKCRTLHDQMIGFLKRKSDAAGSLDSALIDAWRIFGGIKQNWLRVAGSVVVSFEHELALIAGSDYQWEGTID